MNFRNWTAALAGTVALCLAGVAKADETSLIFATTDPGTIALNVQLLHPWADRVNEQGKGFVHIDVRDGSALADHTNFYDRVQDDVIQVGFGQLAYIGGKFPRSAILTLPFVAETSSEVASVAFWRLYKSGLVNAEYDSIVPILFASLPPAGLHLAKPAATLDNLNGLKITIVAKAMGEAVSRLGGTPLSIAAPDIYEAIQRGTANGAVMTWNGLTTFKLQEVTTYHVETSLGATLAVLFMAKKRYDALPAAAQRIIDANSGEAESRRAGIYYDNIQAAGRDLVKAGAGQQIVNLSPQQAASWRERIAPVTEDWVKATPDGDKILAKFRALLAEVKAGK